MLFSELYSAYYNAVAAVLTQAISRPLSEEELRGIVEQHTFAESSLHVLPMLREGRWPLLCADGITALRCAPTMPLTLLQKRWLAAIAQDPRIRLFGDTDWAPQDVKPLFTPEDVLLFDRYADGDPYEDENYRANFRLILDAVHRQYPLEIEMQNRKGKVVRRVVLPKCLEYSEKDDKFRLIGHDRLWGSTVNLGRILRCRLCAAPDESACHSAPPAPACTLVLELTDERNALERVLLHFAHFDTYAEKTGENAFRITLTYSQDDETEMVIRVLSFGPLVKVTEPPHFVRQIKQRLYSQKSCEQ